MIILFRGAEQELEEFCRGGKLVHSAIKFGADARSPLPALDATLRIGEGWSFLSSS